MGNAVASVCFDARRLEEREFGKTLAPETHWRGRHWHDAREKSNAPHPALWQSNDHVYLAPVDHIRAVLGAANRGECRGRDPCARLLGAQPRDGNQIGHQRFEMIALQSGDVIGLGCGKEDAIDASAKQEPKQAAPAKTEHTEYGFERQAVVGKSLFPGVERSQYVDKNDLPIDACGASAVLIASSGAD